MLQVSIINFPALVNWDAPFNGKNMLLATKFAEFKQDKGLILTINLPLSGKRLTTGLNEFFDLEIYIFSL